MTNDVRYRGTMRLGANGIEIISEESRQRGRAPSYILTDTERDGIAAYIRYLDSMDERKRLERDWDLDRVYYPRFPTRVRRKIRNFGIALKNSAKKTVEMIWGQIKKARVSGLSRQNRERSVRKVKLKICERNCGNMRWRKAMSG